MELLSPRGILREKTEDACEELKKDEPMLILISPSATLCISGGDSRAHRKIMPIPDDPGAHIVLCARGNPSDLVVFKSEINNSVAGFAKAVDARDLSGRMLAMTAAKILRTYYLKEPRALAVQAAFLDFADPEDPACVISPTGDQFVGKNFLLKDSEITPIANPPQTLREMKEYAKSIGIPAEGQEHVWVFMHPMPGQTDAEPSPENPPPEQPE